LYCDFTVIFFRLGREYEKFLRNQSLFLESETGSIDENTLKFETHFTFENFKRSSIC